MERRCTYRLQLRPEFGFDEAAAQVDYLAALGVSHAYFSPYLQAAAGSTHGYDVVDPTRLNADLGGEEAHARLCAALRASGLTQLLDIVPNHMSVDDRRNRWWWDVLADGQQSPYADFFDIDWEVDEPRVHGRVLLPVLGDQIGRVLEAGEISLVLEDGSLLIAYFEKRFPLRLETVAELLAATGQAALGELTRAITVLPEGPDENSRAQRADRRSAIQARLAEQLADHHMASTVQAVLEPRNADLALLDHVLNQQHHRLARWRTATEEVNYRRFFDINTLVALRVEGPKVFGECHRLALRLVRAGEVDGLRIDHIDGLRRPLEYAQRLRDAAPADTWLLAEKVLERHEEPPSWALDGTSGYDFLAAVNGLFVDPRGQRALEELHREVTGQGCDFEQFALGGKREVLRTTLVSDVERMVNLLARVCDAYPAHRDHTHSELTDALVEVIAALPVYRTYVDPRRRAVSDADAGLLRGAAASARSHAPEVDPRLLDFIADLFVFGEGEDVATGDGEELGAVQSDLVLRLQQLCAATTAKGVEDTACYRHLVLVSLNEVGDSPSAFGVSLDDFHSRNARTHAERPATLLATSTHDTKRSEDVRCRIDLISEIPEEWSAAVLRWRAMNQVHRRDGMPDGAAEYLLYQTLVGAHPLPVERAVAYMEKASREAKQQTSWLLPNPEYEEALRGFVRDVLADVRFLADLEGFGAMLVAAGRVNSLATTALKLTSPGVPDLYQGTEVWDLSLVDPDNRRPVDYEERRALLAEASSVDGAEAWRTRQDSGLPKLLLIKECLELRRRLPHLFDQRGAYAPLRARGEFADDVVAFARGTPAAAITVVPRGSLRRRGDWGDTMLTLPAGLWRNLLDRQPSHRGSVSLPALLHAFPVAVLERTE